MGEFEWVDVPNSAILVVGAWFGAHSNLCH